MPSSSPSPIVDTVPARAAIAGNPSDGYGGAVTAIPVPALGATVTVADADDVSIEMPDGSTFRRASVDELLDDAAVTTADDPAALVLATIADLAEQHRPAFDRVDGLSISVTTTIPRSVGLAGSSAIVIASMRSLSTRLAVPPGHPDVQASIARRIEADRLGIACGLQDRVVQAHGTAMYMSFSDEHVRTLDGLPCGTYRPVEIADGLRMLIAWRASTSESSGIVHGDLRSRHDAGDPTVGRVMDELAQLAAAAEVALRRGDVAAAGAAMDGSFDLRARIVDVRDDHREMIDAARIAGAWANSAGSGGSVVVLSADRSTEDRTVASLRDLGCALVRPSGPL